MAVIFLFRAAVAIGASTRVVRSSQGTEGPSWGEVVEYFENRGLWDFDGSDLDLSVAMSEYSGYSWQVETISGTFELRKDQIRWKRNGGAAGGTDDAVTTHHWLYAPGGTPSDTWTGTQFTAVESAFATLWAAIDDAYTTNDGPKQHRWYKAGPGITPPQVPVRITDLTMAETGGGTLDHQAPQTSISVTEKTTDPKSWGRFYLPAMASSIETMYGRVDGTFQLALTTAVAAFYETCIGADVFPVVYSAAKAERETKAGATLPAAGARALPVKQVQVDDLFDVIRSRRYNEPLLRIQNDIAGS